MRILLLIVAALGPIVALIFGTHALWYWLAVTWTVSIASAVVAGAYLLLASAAAITFLFRQEQKKEEPPAPIAGLIGLLEDSIQKKPVETVGAMVAVGVVLGRRPDLLMKVIQKVL
ncbi:hypothetical protein GCM10011367_16750 [Marinicauda pacifica]|uniref:Phage holin family protein n=1 Tax=Marinicauda pacifica TaxID=1133559 RepID=A0A4S2HBP4_9PROT|nr:MULTISPECIES: hypothetical protein [Marinicauda]TGY93081.1 hypothetical protein E5162_08445 [Marinicauda pacifica]GGE42635.1 hypothetical protein GCM10011367_16750 [Marinicauda pacifica]